MEAQRASLINAIAMIFVSIYLFYSELNAQAFNLIPLIFGVVLLVLNNGVTYGIRSQLKAALFCNLFATFFSVYRFYAAYDMRQVKWMTGMGMLVVTSLIASVAIGMKIFKK